MQIRSARPEEAGLLTGIALRSKAYWGYDEAFMAACRDELTLDAAAIERAWAVVAEDGERVVGFATVTGTPPEAQLDMLFVEPDVIGRGVGRALFACARGRAEELGCRRLTIDSDPNAEPFYRAMGAVRIGVTPSGSIPGRELPLLVLELAQGN
ncbi:GNAT family N-acetyltransferase [Kitasatospora aureofaciens]|uniref:GNAT family N-acetyltransferase n=1 Tax=Kitasatospora aureofaciens TaxID=1894 RepID=UPI001C483385|nr:GNAT family N-acetyltransferase [Kitasatospora aureofaciens]MBV6698540.1 GNAT family N-acetyltransferase [Kitasatospora aureofaciens]